MNLGRVIAGYRKKERYGVRAMAKEIGISHATLSRIENNKDCDSRSMTKILLWLIGDDGKCRTRSPKTGE